LSPRSLRGQCGVLVPVRAGTLGWARPLPVPSRGCDGGEVMRPSSAVRLRQEEGVVADPGLSVRSGLLGLTGPLVIRNFTS
jgi:hypothetical protein